MRLGAASTSHPAKLHGSACLLQHDNGALLLTPSAARIPAASIPLTCHASTGSASSIRSTTSVTVGRRSAMACRPTHDTSQTAQQLHFNHTLPARAAANAGLRGVSVHQLNTCLHYVRAPDGVSDKWPECMASSSHIIHAADGYAPTLNDPSSCSSNSTALKASTRS
jgi:hypothetical protein